MSDGPIPLFGSLPSAVSRQWGFQQENKTFSFPLAMNNIFSFTATHSTVARNYVKIAVNLMNAPIASIVTEIAGESHAYYFVIGN